MNLEIAETESTPKVSYDASFRSLRVEGESYPENVAEFYQPIREWIATNVGAGSEFRLVLALYYLNTGSTKALLDIIRLLDRKADEGARVEVIWFYLKNLELMRSAGEELLKGRRLSYRIEAMEAE